VSQWQIDPAVVVGILTDVYNQVSGEEGVAGSGLAGAVTQEGAEAVVDDAWVCGAPPALGATYLGAVPQALVATLSGVLQDMGKVGNRVMAGVVGVAAATQAYQYGQEDMCGAAESAMATAADSGDFAWFEANGYMEAGA